MPRDSIQVDSTGAIQITPEGAIVVGDQADACCCGPTVAPGCGCRTYFPIDPAVACAHGNPFFNRDVMGPPTTPDAGCKPCGVRWRVEDTHNLYVEQFGGQVRHVCQADNCQPACGVSASALVLSLQRQTYAAAIQEGRFFDADGPNGPGECTLQFRTLQYLIDTLTLEYLGSLPYYDTTSCNWVYPTPTVIRSQEVRDYVAENPCIREWGRLPNCFPWALEAAGCAPNEFDTLFIPDASVYPDHPCVFNPSNPCQCSYDRVFRDFTNVCGFDCPAEDRITNQIDYAVNLSELPDGWELRVNIHKIQTQATGRVGSPALTWTREATFENVRRMTILEFCPFDSCHSTTARQPGAGTKREMPGSEVERLKAKQAAMRHPRWAELLGIKTGRIRGTGEYV